MARPLQNLTCPFCHTKRSSRATRTGNATRLERYYLCTECGNEFTTIERVSRAPLDGVYVLRPSAVDDRRRPRPKVFVVDSINEHLRVLLRKLLTEGQRDALVNRVMQELPKRLDRMERLPDDEVDKWFKEGKERPIVLPAAEIRKVIEECLVREAARAQPKDQPRYEAAHALYLMSAANRSLNDAMVMLARTHPTKIGDGTLPLPRPLAAERWHYPLNFRAPQPRMVVKNFWRSVEQSALYIDSFHEVANEDVAASRQPRNRVSFSQAALDASIVHALGASPSAVLGDQTLSRQQIATNIREWVLWKLDGQPVVRSSQLSAEIAAVLRRCAPLPYIRWVTIGKELKVDEIFEEARCILETPPIALIFDQDAAPRMHGSVSPAVTSARSEPGQVPLADVVGDTLSSPEAPT